MASVETIALGASARTESASAQDQYVIGPYLNQGGMATVFLGKHIGRTGISTPIVLKRLRSELTHVPELRALLFSEAELQSLASQLQRRAAQLEQQAAGLGSNK